MRTRSTYLFSVAALSGGAGMALEMAVSRRLLPYYGDSHVVWANLIGLVMLSLSLGYRLGGAAADRWPSARLLAPALLAAAAWTALLPAWGPPMLESLQSLLPFGEAGALLGSLLAVAALLGLPMLLLGLVPPFVIRLLLRRVAGAGRLSGRVYAVATVGSMVGTFAPVLWWLPDYGIEATFYILAGLLALWGAAGLAIGGPDRLAGHPDLSPSGGDVAGSP